jgi:hypothetical protein
MSNLVRSLVVGTALVLVAQYPAVIQAQTHAQGAAWIHRDDDQATMLHAVDDPLSWLEFPDRCWMGMMSPDSLLCEFWTVEPESLPDSCFSAYGCSIDDDSGHSMMSGHMMPGDFFRRQVDLTFHYDPAAVVAAGADATNLVLVTIDGGNYEVVAGANHVVAQSLFQLSTSQVASWYGVVDRSSLPTAVRSVSWADLKRGYR